MFSGNFDASHKRDKANDGKRGGGVGKLARDDRLNQVRLVQEQLSETEFAKSWGDLMDRVDDRRDGETCENNDELWS